MSRPCVPRDPTCPVARAITVLQEKWVLHIVHTLLDGPRGFNELGREVGGCNPTTLTQRLARLEEVGLVTRSEERDRRGRSFYRLTSSGEALSDVIEAIHAWSVQHLHSAGPLIMQAESAPNLEAMTNGESQPGDSNGAATDGAEPDHGESNHGEARRGQQGPARTPVTPESIAAS